VKKTPKFLLLLLVALLTLSCAAKTASSPSPADGFRANYGLEEPAVVEVSREEKAVWADDGGADIDEALGVPGTSEVTRKMIYTVSLHLIVQDADEAMAEVERLAQDKGGFVSESNVWKSEGYRQATVTVRIPAEDLNGALAAFRDLALDVESENVDSQDVTEEYVDLEARLTNEQRTEEELLELLETRSEIGKTEDILEVHRELKTVRAEIERIQGRMRYLDNLSAMATVRLTLTPDELLEPIDVGGWRPQGTAREAVRLLLRTLQFFADAAIVFVLFILPTLIVIAIPIVILVLIIRGLVRRSKRHKREKAKEAE
jgi:hypothetical protein